MTALAINLLPMKFCPICEKQKPSSRFLKTGSKKCFECRADYSSHLQNMRRAQYLWREVQTYSLADFQKKREEDGQFCAKCGSPDRIVGDHIVSLCIGGKNELSNIQFLCHDCNSKKLKNDVTNYRTGESMPIPSIESVPCRCGTRDQWGNRFFRFNCGRCKMEAARLRYKVEVAF